MTAYFTMTSTQGRCKKLDQTRLNINKTTRIFWSDMGSWNCKRVNTSYMETIILTFLSAFDNSFIRPLTGAGNNTSLLAWNQLLQHSLMHPNLQLNRFTERIIKNKNAKDL